MLSATYQEHYRKNFMLAYPVMLSQLGQVLVGVADSLMVGRLGAEPLAAASLGNVIFYMIMVFGLGVSYALTPLIAAADGENNQSKIIGIFRNGLMVNTILGMILALGVFLCTPVLYHMDQPPEVVDLSIPYLRIITVSMVPFMLFQSFRQFAEGLGNTKKAMFITVSANALNIILNYMLIYGKMGFPALGLNGAGWATLISRVIMAVAMGLFVYRARRFHFYQAAFKTTKYSWEVMKRILRVGVPTGMQFIFEVSAFGVTAIMMGWLGTKPLAAHQIAINLASISYMMATGIASAASIRVGNQLGQKRYQSMREVGYTSFIMVALFMGIAALIFILFRNYFPMLYVDDPEVIAIAGSLLVVAALFQISDGVQVVGMGALRGMEDVRIPALIAVTSYWLLGLPSGYLLGFGLGMGAQGVWLGLLIGLSVAAVLLYWRFGSTTKRIMNLI
ncbi:MAG: MATE family efflux transporter [Cyclobacteriaceae bacterium]|nr:MATE family efflux transporter [Cyclobacteriaceae bacterium]